MAKQRIPNPVAVVVGDIIGGYYYNHGRLNRLFYEKGAPGDPPEGNCRVKCEAWLKRCNDDPKVDALAVLGRVLEEFMEVDASSASLQGSDVNEESRKRIRDVLARYGLGYSRGGRIMSGASALPTRTLHDNLRAGDLAALQTEFDRSAENLETDPAASITASCAIVEALCKVYIEDEHLELPADQTIKPLWKVVQKHLGLDPASLEDDDLKRILTGLASIVDGLGAFRTHAGSAHGRGRKSYRVAPRHARLTVHAAHSLTIFALETWQARKDSRVG